MTFVVDCVRGVLWGMGHSRVLLPSGRGGSSLAVSNVAMREVGDGCRLLQGPFVHESDTYKTAHNAIVF